MFQLSVACMRRSRCCCLSSGRVRRLESGHMEGPAFDFGHLAYAPEEFEGTRWYLEYTFRDAVLPVVVSQVECHDPWECEQPATFATLENLRGTCSSWKEFVEGTVEWGALILARAEFQALATPRWVDEEEYVHSRFRKHRSLFSASWRLQQPLADDRWRTAAFSTLTGADLAGLSVALEEDGESCEVAAEAVVFRPAANLWICPSDRVGAR